MLLRYSSIFVASMLFSSCSSFITTKNTKIFDTGITGDKEASGCIKKIFGIPVSNDFEDWQKIAKESEINFPTSAYMEMYKINFIYESNCVNVKGKNYSVSGLKSVLSY